MITPSTIAQIEAVLLLLFNWQVDENGWSFQAGQIGGGMGYTKAEAARDCTAMMKGSMNPWG